MMAENDYSNSEISEVASVEESDEMEEVDFSNSRVLVPYENEPPANVADDIEEDDSDGDEDGITPGMLAARFEGRTAVGDWLVAQNYLGGLKSIN